MKSQLLAFVVYLLALAVARAEEPAATLASGTSLTLTDGRAFKDWKIKRQTAASVFVLSPLGIATVDKRVLPADLRAKFPYDEVAVAQEKKDLELAAAAGRAHGAEIEARKKAEYDARVAKAAPKVKEQQTMLKVRPAAMKELGYQPGQSLDNNDYRRIEDMQENFLEGPDGAMPVQLKVNGHSAQIGLWNFTKAPVKFDWKKMRGLMFNKAIVEPVSVTPSLKTEDPEWLTIPPDGKRYYTIEFGEGLPSTLRMVSLYEDRFHSAIGAAAR